MTYTWPTSEVHDELVNQSKVGSIHASQSLYAHEVKVMEVIEVGQVWMTHRGLPAQILKAYSVNQVHKWVNMVEQHKDGSLHVIESYATRSLVYPMPKPEDWPL